MNIETEDYQIAPLPEQSKILSIIEETEKRLSSLTGDEITLIAYTKTHET